jgi:putative acetyltransferase
MYIRLYKSGEEQRLWKLYYDTTHIINGEIYTKKQVERWAPSNKNMDEWKERIEKKKPFVAIDDEKIVGFAELDADGYIDFFYVHCSWQRKGVGAMLYDTLERNAVDQKMPRLYAEVSVSAKDFFLHRGFTVLKKQNNIVCGDPAPNYKMEKWL